MTQPNTLGRTVRLLTLGIVVSAAGAGCIRAQAKSAPEGPPLDVPAPPARIVAPMDEPIVPAPTEPHEPASAPASSSRRPPRRSQPTTSEPAQRPDPSPVPETVPQATAPPEPVNTTPAPTLRAPGSAEKPIRDLVVRAQRDLSRVDYAKLSEAGKTQYEQSKRFAEQAEIALKDQNFVFAQTLAEKAVKLAAELSDR